MSSLRLSYASSPESDLEHSPGPPVSSNSPTAGRLTKASSDPSVVMPDSSTTDVLPPYQVRLSYVMFVYGDQSLSENKKLHNHDMFGSECFQSTTLERDSCRVKFRQPN